MDMMEKQGKTDIRKVAPTTFLTDRNNIAKNDNSVKSEINNFDRVNETRIRLKEQFFSDEAIDDLLKSGLDYEIIQEAQIIPATQTELDNYKIHWFDKNRRQERFKPLYIIPYHVLATDEGKFCRVKVKALPNYPDFSGKYSQPNEQVLKNTTHLYILPSEIEKLKSPKCKIAIVEGEKKALKLLQEIRKIENELGYKVAVIGISGINNWQEFREKEEKIIEGTPEWKLIDLKGKECLIFFDADSEYNVNVIKAELELAGFLYSKGAGSVKSSVWSISEGKGIDDFLVNADNPLEKLKTLLLSTISVFQKYQDKLQDKELIRAFFKYPVKHDKARIEYLIELIKDDTKISKRTIESVVKILRIEWQEEQKEKLQKRIKEVFGTDNINIPSGYIWEEGFLKDKQGNIITKFFIVDKEVVDENNKTLARQLKFIDREFYISNENFNRKDLTLIFNYNGIPMDEKTAIRVMEYITQYQNVNNVVKESIINRTGWINEDYYLPQLCPDKIFNDELEGFGNNGSKEKELELMKKLYREASHLAIGYVLAFASTLIEKLKTGNFIVYHQGLTGRGKTLTNRVALSVFGDNEELIRNLNNTEVGLELYLDKRKDVLVVLDELNTSNKDVVRQISKLIYDFESKKGRQRADKHLKLRNISRFRGIVSITSEDSLRNILSKAERTNKGALRRTITIDYSDFQKIDKRLAFEVSESISEHYGNLIVDWISYVKNNEEEIEKIYKQWIFEFLNEDRGFSFNGQERFLALLFATNELIGRVFNIDTSSISEYLWQIADYNHIEFDEATQITKDRLKTKIEQFISENIQHFEYIRITNGVVVAKNVPKKALGKIENWDRETGEFEIYLTSIGMKELSNYVGLSEREVKKLLVDFGFAEGDDIRIIKKTTKIIAEVPFNAYRIGYKQELFDNNDTETIDLDNQQNENEDVRLNKALQELIEKCKSIESKTLHIATISQIAEKHRIDKEKILEYMKDSYPFYKLDIEKIAKLGFKEE